MPPAAPPTEPARSSRRRWWIGSALLVAGVAAGALLAWGSPDPRPVLAAIRAAGIWAPALFVFLQVVLTVGPVPRTVFTVAAGVLFGSAVGAAVAVLATVGAAALAFWLVRAGTARLVARHADRRAVRWTRERLERRGLLAVLSLRLLPMVPFPVLNYASGASGMRFGPYLLGTALGVLPGTLAVVVLSDAAVGGAPDPRLLAVSVVCGVVGAAGVLAAARRPTA
ncbi:MAG: TVP38/TMEM64 family protein [Pseudonocardia sp.]